MTASALRLPVLSKEVADRLTLDFGTRFTARHNSSVVYPLEQLVELHVDVWPQSLERNKTQRTGFGRVITLAVAIQQQADNQEKMDLLTDLADDVLDWFLESGRWAGGKLLVNEGAFSGTDVFDRFTKYELNVFQAILLIPFKQLI